MKLDFDKLLDPAAFIGRAPEQTREFIAAEVEPIRRKYKGRLGQAGELKV